MTRDCSRQAKIDPGLNLTSFRYPGENQFGIERLQSVVAQLANGSLENMQAAILGAIDEFTRGTEQADDITLLILRYQSW